jgi:2-methylcitrate dehydratase PrpD
MGERAKPLRFNSLYPVLEVEEMTITRELVDFCLRIDVDRLPEEVVDRCKYLLLDFLGVVVRGQQRDSTHTLLKFALAHGCPGNAAVIGTGYRLNPCYASLVNGAAAHSLELDDVANEASLHPGTVIFPTVLALGSELKASGREIIAAVVVGYEAMVKIGKALNPALHYRRGFHPTGTCGVFGAAMAAAKLLHLDAQQMLWAAGIAGSQASGSMEFLTDGAWTKRFHAGWSAHNGIIAARLAEQGFTGPSAILEGKHGFLKAYSEQTDATKVTTDLGRPFEVLRTSIKPHACCRYMQSPIDGVLQIVQTKRLRAAEITRIKIGLLSAGYEIVSAPGELKYNVRSTVDAQFSMPYGAAIAAVKGRAFLEEFLEESIGLPEVTDLMLKVDCIKDPELDAFYPRQWPAWVKIETSAGEAYHAEIMYPKGDPENPLHWDEIIEKFLSLTRPVLAVHKQEQIIECVRMMEKQAEVSHLLKLCSP